MKRIVIVVLVLLGVGAAGVTAAHAGNQGPSTWCTSGDGSETDVPNPAVGLSADYWSNWNGWRLATVCYSTTPTGSSAPEAAGGAFRVGYRQDTTWEESVGVWCFGDRTASTMATVDCEGLIWTTDDWDYSTLGRSASGRMQVGAASPVGIARTGVDIRLPDITTSTSPSKPAAATSAVSGTCIWVNGSANCPGGGTVAGVSVATGDIGVSTRTVSGGCVGALGNPCITTVPSGVAVTAGGGDAANPTVDGYVFGVGPVRHDVAKTCVVNVFTDCTTP